MKDVFKEYFIELVGQKHAQSFFDAVSKKDLRRSLRVNTLRVEKKDLDGWLKEHSFEIEENPYSREGLDLNGKGDRLSLKLPYHAGWDYPQDSASMFAVELLNPQPGEMVIDMTAAPGGKSTHIAQRMENKGVLFSNDLDKGRLKALHSNFERLGIYNGVITRMKAHDLTLMYPEKFDRILLDPSCSGEGLLVTRDGKPSHWTLKGMKRYTKDQFSLLCSAFRLLKPGGRLVYSTCTLNDLEDDGVVKQIMNRYPEAELDIKAYDELNIEIPPQLLLHPGTDQEGQDIGIRFWPQITRTKGFYCVAITKTEALVELEGELIDWKRAHDRMKKVKLRAVRKKEVKILIQRLEKKYGKGILDHLDVESFNWIKKDQNIFIVSDKAFASELPYYHALSFPLMKIQQEKVELTHPGMLFIFGGIQDSNSVARTKDNHSVLELSFEQTQSIFQQQREHPGNSYLKMEDFDFDEDWEKAKKAQVAIHKNFPIGRVRFERERVYIEIPRQH